MEFKITILTHRMSPYINFHIIPPNKMKIWMMTCRKITRVLTEKITNPTM